MKTSHLIGMLVATPAFAVSIGLDGGGSYIALSAAKFGANGARIPFHTNEDRTAWSPYVGVRIEMSEMLAMRLSYQYIGGLQTHASWYPYPPFGAPIFAELSERHYESNIQVSTFGPQFRFKVYRTLAGFISPEASWVYDQESWRQVTAIGEGSALDNSANKITMGGSAGLRWSIYKRWTVEGGYKYIDVKPSFGRKAHAVTLGLTFQ